MKKIVQLIFIMLAYFQTNAQIISYTKYNFGDGTNLPFDKEFDLMIPFKEQKTFYYDSIYLYKHQGSKSLKKSIEKTGPPIVKHKAIWEKNKTGDSIFLKIEIRNHPSSKKYSLLKPSGTYSLIFFNGVNEGSFNIINSLDKEYNEKNGNIESKGIAYQTFEKEVYKQKFVNKIITYKVNPEHILDKRKMEDTFFTYDFVEDFKAYIDFYKNTLLPTKKYIDSLKKVDSIYKFECDKDYFNTNCIATLFNFVNGKGCIPTLIRCIDTCKVSSQILSLNKINCSNIAYLLKGNAILNNLDQSENYIADDKYNLRRTNLEKSLSNLYEIRNLILNFNTQLTTIQECKNQIRCLEELSTKIDKLISELGTTNKRVSEIIKLTSDPKSLFIESHLFIDYDITGLNTHIYNFKTRNEMSITPVFGYAYYGFQKGFNGFTPYLGFQINFQGLNRNDPFNQIKSKTIWQRTCFTTAWTLTGVQEPNKRYDLFDKSSLITALGYKFSHVIVINGGLLWFKKENPNALVTSKSITVSPVLSLAVNLEIENLLNGFNKLIPIK